MIISAVLVSCSATHFLIGYNFDKLASHKELDNLKPGRLYKIKIGRFRTAYAKFDSTSSDYKLVYFKNKVGGNDYIHKGIIESIEEVKFPIYRVIGFSVGIMIDAYLLYQSLVAFSILTGRN